MSCSNNKRIRLTPKETKNLLIHSKKCKVITSDDILMNSTYFGIIVEHINLLHIFTSILRVSKFMNNFINNDNNKKIIERIFKNEFYFSNSHTMTTNDIKILLTKDIEEYFKDILYNVPYLEIDTFYPLPKENIFKFIIKKISKLKNESIVTKLKIGEHKHHIIVLLCYCMHVLVDQTHLSFDIKRKYLLNTQDIFIWYQSQIIFPLGTRRFLGDYFADILHYTYFFNDILEYDVEFYPYYVNKQFELIILKTNSNISIKKFFQSLILPSQFIKYANNFQIMSQEFLKLYSNIEYCTQIFIQNKKLKHCFSKQNEINLKKLFNIDFFNTKSWSLMLKYSDKIAKLLHINYKN